MRLLIHDFSGHPFQVQLSRELSRRGHSVVHSSCASYVTGKGKLEAGPGESIVFETIGEGLTYGKLDFRRRLIAEIRMGVQLIRHVRSHRPDVVVLSNVQIPMLVLFAAAMLVYRTPWVLWHQDVYAVAIKSFAGDKLSKGFRVVASVFDVAERWVSKRSTAIVAISDAFVPVHERWGTADKVTVIPNWAPLDEIVPVNRKNDWAVEHHLDDKFTLLYSGTLGLKHDPKLLVSLTHEVRRNGVDAHLVVVNEGPAKRVIAHEAERLGVPVTLLPFQPYESLPEVLGSGDVLLTLLDARAGAFSVPSKTLSYLSAGRPILGLMPPENAASDLVQRAGGAVFAPHESSIPAAGAWIAELLQDQFRMTEISESSRDLAESEFCAERCIDRFEKLFLELAD